ncbi:MAG: sulfite exporter TauE/SafE family protein [Candidatus Lokiarchaeota archaeon]|nr:sulfite exporter TauE/SafE family protein [Candidatus Lokiarchaeota archaeon]
MIIYFSLIAIFFSSMVYGIIGFGDALILIPIITPLIGIKNAVILVNLWGILTALLNFIKYRTLLDKGYFIRFLSLGIPATIFGTFLLIEIRLEWIELILGIFIFGYSTLRLCQYLKKKEDIELKSLINTTSPLIIAGGFSYGLLAALIGAVGPLNVAMLEKTGHYRENFIENFAAIGFSLSIARTPFYFTTNIFPYDLFLLFLLGFPIIFLGTKFGQRLTPKIPIKAFQVVVFCFLIVISVKSITTSIISLLLN